MPSCTVFVGNIAHDAPDAEVQDLFREVGDVVDFRMMHDSATGKRKGYTFCKYKDDPTARMAIQNLNGYELRGRPLRVDLSAKLRESKNYLASGSGRGALSSATRQSDIASALEMLTHAEIHVILDEFRTMIQRDRAGARKLLTEKPILCQALLQAQLMLGMSTNAPKKSNSNEAKTAQLMSLTKEDIAKLPAEQQANVRQPKKQLGGARGNFLCVYLFILDKPSPQQQLELEQRS